MSLSERLTTFEIGSIYGIAPRSLRFYEDQGLLSPIVEDGGRFYTAKDRIKLELIIKGKQLGFSFIELKILILETIDKKATSEGSSSSALTIRQSLAKEKIVEEIWQSERKIEALTIRVKDLQSQLVLLGLEPPS